MAKEYAPGIPRKGYFPNTDKLKPGQLLDYVVQRHQATRRGLHYDLRLGNKPMGMFSWASNQPPPTHEGERMGLIRTNQHTADYNKFEGIIPAGNYGAGRVSTHEIGKALVTNTTPNTISYSLAHKKHPERYTLIKPEGYTDRQWILIKAITPTESGADKLHYKNIPESKIMEVLKGTKPNTEVQAKVDGALHFLNVGHKQELLSHRKSKITGKPVVQTERFFGNVPHEQVPKELRNSVLRTEVYGEQNGKVIPNQELGGILNSSVSKALTDMKDRNIQLKGLLFDIAKLHGQPVDVNQIPYSERKKILNKFLSYLPKGKFEVAKGTNDPDEAVELYKDIKEGKNPSTVEGVVVHPEKGVPAKHKVMPEADVFITGTFPAETNSKYDGKGVGGFTYSVKPNGPTIGRIGTGLIDRLRIDAYNNPDKYKGRVAVIHSHGQFEKSQAHRVPALLRIHEDYDVNNPPPRS